MIGFETKNILHLNQEFVSSKLKELNGSLLKTPYKEMWERINPTYGYCYIVSEALFHYAVGVVKPFCMSMNGSTHWYVTIDGEIVDFTAEQFLTPVDYSKGVGKGFFKGSIQTSKGFISKRGYEIAKHLELI